ncbi:hypothetical protein BCR32DRAFT_290849 [Anaeromyces robustus]|uniref:Uncharacterized protein n=1 Tax=Anaeromyces robustus TaxID=1754192 RepID=A0A1Y1XIJ8_9FUNG|nr:hypothetical protein BCR32DRAFT_290849 [Anaeromyces robustus]|eukprot:ORX85184.1 hypothetical protein BCR32DRAFT_290849 [Anaeromyces robustus]
MDFQYKYCSELKDEEIIPFTTEALDVVETVVSFFCDCLNKNEPKFVTLTNGNLSPAKEDIQLNSSLEGDPTEKICEETTLIKTPTVFCYDKDTLLGENKRNDINTSFDKYINNTDDIINKIEEDFNNKTTTDYDNLSLSSDSEDEDYDGAPACVLATKKNTSISNLILKSSNSSEKVKSESHESFIKDTPENTPNKSRFSINSKYENLEGEEEEEEEGKAKEKETNKEKEDDTNSLDFPMDELDNHSNIRNEKKNHHKNDEQENNKDEDNNENENENENDNENENENENEEEDPFEENNENEDDNFNENEDEGNFNEEEVESEGNFNENLEEQEEEEKEKKSNSKLSINQGNEEDKSNSNKNNNNNNKEKKDDSIQINPTPMPNLEELNSKFSSQVSFQDSFYVTPNFLYDSNDEINFIPIQEKEGSNCIKWKYHIKHHSTNKKLRCSNFLIIWSQPTKINPVPKATAEMWMIYYHTSNIGKNDATITYRFNGYYNTHEINVYKFMKEYKKYKADPNIEITKKEFPTLYTPLLLNPKKWLPELIRSKLLISNDIMNGALVN